MSSANSVSTALQSGRRFHARRRMDGLTYVHFGTENGAILVDLGEGGLGFQSILPVSMDQALPLKFKLPGDSNPIEGYAEVAWLDESRKGGGLRFVELSADAFAQIRGWTGVLSAPNAGAPQPANRSALNSAPTSASERTPANSMPERTRPERTVPEPTGGGEVPTQVYEAFGGAESAQIADPSKTDHHRGSRPCDDIRPHQGRQGDEPAGDRDDPSHHQEIASAEITGWFKRILATIENPWGDIMARQMRQSIECAVPETSEAPSTDEFAGEPVQADPGVLPGVSLVPESAVHVIPAADSTERLAPRVDSASSAAPSTRASESALPDEPERKIDDGVEAAASVDSAARTSEIPKTVGIMPNVAFHPSSEIEPLMQSAPTLQESFGHTDLARTREVTSGFSTPAPATPASDTQVAASDLRNFVPVQMRLPRPAPSKPESRLQPEGRQDSTVRESFPRQSLRPVPAARDWENLLPSEGEELKPQATLASHALKLGIGAAAGASLMLALIAGIPSLRTRVQATVNARVGSSNLANSAVFQVEVADLNNRRWILKSGAEAGSPLSDTLSRRERQPEASTAARNESVKSSPSHDSEDSSNTDTPQLKLPRPRELALSRPHVTQAQAPFSQLMAPSIFDGITPPIGSVNDGLATSGLGAPGPGIAGSQNQVDARRSALQAAVLVQRVEPVYPKIALASGVRGQVRLSVTIGRDGVPRELKVISGDARLVDAAREAISQWRYHPATLGGEPIERQTIVSIDFELR